MSGTNTVFVGLSGGVDSSVAALRLQQRGFRVVGVFIKVWHPDWMVCNWEQERLDAMRVAAHLGIPFLTCDAEAAYRDSVAQYFIKEYKAGRTPNPDVMCNKEVKFGSFLEFARTYGAKYIATGHYARIAQREGTPALLRGLDPAKDQSYFLWTLTTEQLTQVLLPVGDTHKPDIRKEAEAAGIPTAAKKDSQGVCFLGHIDIPEFLSHYVDLEPGVVLDEAGESIGSHQGALVYTIGQRHGFTLTDHNTKRAVHYVTNKDCEANTITVSPTVPMIKAQTDIHLSNTIFRRTLTVGETIAFQTRYHQLPMRGMVQSVNTDTLILTTTNEISAVASGQSCVLYDGEVCIGGGIIE